MHTRDESLTSGHKILMSRYSKKRQSWGNRDYRSQRYGQGKPPMGCVLGQIFSKKDACWEYYFGPQPLVGMRLPIVSGKFTLHILVPIPGGPPLREVNALIAGQGFDWEGADEPPDRYYVALQLSDVCSVELFVKDVVGFTRCVGFNKNMDDVFWPWWDKPR